MSVIYLHAAVADADWRDAALCAQADPDLWFPPKGRVAREAKRICLGCPVRRQCLEEALALGETDGIWGGLTPRQRHVLKGERQEAA
jgi:WhiB family redox-sensing transcriptional regulator